VTAKPPQDSQFGGQHPTAERRLTTAVPVLTPAGQAALAAKDLVSSCGDPENAIPVDEATAESHVGVRILTFRVAVSIHRQGGDSTGKWRGLYRDAPERRSMENCRVAKVSRGLYRDLLLLESSTLPSTCHR
jgi:hypothetical protein